MSLAASFPSQMLSLGGGAADQEVVLSFSVAEQEMPEWCWAAVASSVAHFLSPTGSGQSQCQIASELLDRSCCITPRPADCNVTNELHLALSHVGCLREMLESQFLNSDGIWRELNAGLPVAIRVEWDNYAGHYVCIYGIQQTYEGIKVAVSDPIYGDGAILLSALVAGGYQSSGGKWTDTYVLQR